MQGECGCSCEVTSERSVAACAGWQLLADVEGIISVGDGVSVTSTRQGLQGLE